MNRDRLKELVAPAIGVVVVAIVAAVLGYLTANTRGERAPGPPSAEAQVQEIRGEITSTSSTDLKIVVNGIEHAYKLAPGARVETLRTGSLADVQVGDWVNGGGINHPMTLYALTGFVVIKPPDLSTR